MTRQTLHATCQSAAVFAAAVHAAGRVIFFRDFYRCARRANTVISTILSPIPGDGPAVFVILIAGFIVVFAALITEIVYQPPYWVHAALWLPLILIVTLAPLRLIKGLLIALQYHHKAAEGRLDRRGEL